MNFLLSLIMSFFIVGGSVLLGVLFRKQLERREKEKEKELLKEVHRRNRGSYVGNMSGRKAWER